MTRSFAHEIQNVQKNDANRFRRMQEISEAMLDDFKEVYDMDIDSYSFRIEYENIRKLAGLSQDYLDLKEELATLERRVTVDDSHISDRRVYSLSALVVLITVLNLWAIYVFQISTKLDLGLGELTLYGLVLPSLVTLIVALPILARDRVAYVTGQGMRSTLAVTDSIVRKLKLHNPGLERLFGRHPYNEGSTIQEGISFLAKDNFEEAIRSFTVILRHNPRNVDAYVKRAYAYYNLRTKKSTNITAAEKDIDRAVQLNPSDAEIHYLRAAILASLGDGEGARNELNKTLAIDKNHVGASLALAEIEEILGN
jgi:tetratricopeptide (TPR) repeat protein